MRLLIFGGTSEGAELARRLPSADCAVTVCVATDYGAQMLEGLPVTVRTGRLNAAEMETLMAGFDAVLDATHPYAVEVSKNIRTAAARRGLPCTRLLRSDEGGAGDWTEVPDAAAAVEVLQKLPGNVLLTTGSKDLDVFSTLPDFRDRVWARILPSRASLDRALELGWPERHLIAMHGPFSEELNLALLRQFDIRVLVTKRSGRAGGFAEKVRAARRAGTALVVLARPEEREGETLKEILARFGAKT